MADKQTILVVEDDPNLSDLLIAFLQLQNYAVLLADWGELAVETCQTHLPNIALLDVRLPDIDGYEVARRLRAHRRTQSIPLIFLTERNERADRIRGLELGAVDYIAKPFDLQELVLRVRNILRRTELPLITNTITGLPEGQWVDERLESLLRAKTASAIVLIQVHQLERFRAQYGFLDADNALRVLAQIIKEAAQNQTSEPDFVGHVTATSFILITHPARAGEVQAHIEKRLAEFMDNFYPLQARLEPATHVAHLEITTSALLPPPLLATSLPHLKALLLQTPVH